MSPTMRNAKANPIEQITRGVRMKAKVITVFVLDILFLVSSCYYFNFAIQSAPEELDKVASRIERLEKNPNTTLGELKKQIEVEDKLKNSGALGFFSFGLSLVVWAMLVDVCIFKMEYIAVAYILNGFKPFNDPPEF